MKVHFQVLYPRGASMRCGIELPDPPTGAAISDVARVFLHSPTVVRVPMWRDGQECDLLVGSYGAAAVGELNLPATGALRVSVSQRTGTPIELIDHRVYGIAVICEPACWPR
jgi:hypothetical protein